MSRGPPLRGTAVTDSNSRPPATPLDDWRGRGGVAEARNRKKKKKKKRGGGGGGGGGCLEMPKEQIHTIQGQP